MNDLDELLALDAIDLRLLQLLQADAARSNQALAEAAFVSPATALRRVRRAGPRSAPIGHGRGVA